MKHTREVQVGVIRSADGESIRGVTLVLVEADIPDFGKFSKITHTDQGKHDVVNGSVQVTVTKGIILELNFVGNTATGRLSYATQLGGFANKPKVDVDLGTTDVTLTVR